MAPRASLAWSVAAFVASIMVWYQCHIASSFVTHDKRCDRPRLYGCFQAGKAICSIRRTVVLRLQPMRLEIAVMP